MFLALAVHLNLNAFQIIYSSVFSTTKQISTAHLEMGPKAQAATQTQAVNTSSKIKQYVLRAINIGRLTWRSVPPFIVFSTWIFIFIVASEDFIITYLFYNLSTIQCAVFHAKNMFVFLISNSPEYLFKWGRCTPRKSNCWVNFAHTRKCIMYMWVNFVGFVKEVLHEAEMVSFSAVNSTSATCYINSYTCASHLVYIAAAFIKIQRWTNQKPHHIITLENFCQIFPFTHNMFIVSLSIRRFSNLC